MASSSEAARANHAVAAAEAAEAAEDEDQRLRSLLLELHTESAILERIVYKGKNQHRRCPYFRALLMVRRDVRLLQSAELGEILSAIFPILHGKKPAQMAYTPARLKKKTSSKYNYQDRLLGVARLLSQMIEPILKAAIQISILLAKSFFTGFSLTVLALLARLRVLVQQILLDVVSVFNKVSLLSQKKNSVKLTQEGIEAFREYYPLSGNVLSLECVWKEDKFLLLERKHDGNTENKDEGRGFLPLETSIQYETIEFFHEGQSNKHELTSEKSPEVNPALNQTFHINSSSVQSATPCVNIVDCKDKSDDAVSACEGSSSVGLLRSPGPLDPQTKLGKKKVAFVQVRKPVPSEANKVGPNKKMKVDPLGGDTTKTDDPFLSLLLGGSGSGSTSLF